MKKTIVLIGILALSINLSMKAQTEFGIKSGVNFSKYSGTLIEAKYKHRIGFYAGGFANFGISENFKLQTEVLFALQGSNLVIEDIEIRDSPNDPTMIGDFKTRTIENTISIPIVAQYYVEEHFYFEAGPQLGFVLDRDDKVVKSPTDDPNFNNVSGLDYDTLDVGLAAGAGYEFGKKLTLNFRYFIGLIERDAFEVKSSVFNLGLEYIL